MKTKRIFLIVLILSFVSAVLQANQIEVWLPGHSNEEMAIIKQLTEETFTKDTGISVSYTTLGWADIENRFLMAAVSGEAPDVGGAGALFIPELGLRGALVDLTSMADFSEVQSQSFPGFYRSLQYKGITFGIPYTATVTTAFQRDDVLRNLGIEKIDTWDELMQILPKMQANGTNFALQWFMSETLYADVNMFMWQRGADDYNEDLTKSGYDDPECIKAFTDYTDLYTKYKIPQEIPVFQAFLSGELALCLGYPPFYQNLTFSAPQIAGKWSMVQAPGYVMDGTLNRTTTGGGQALGIFSTSKRKVESWEFIKWITSEKTQLEISKRIMEQIKGSLFLPSNRGAVAKTAIAKEAALTFEKALTVCTSSVYGLVAPKHRRRYLQMAAQKTILLGIDPKTAITEAADEHNSEISRKQVEYDRFIKRLMEEQIRR
ncbi:MAG: extracellular solute-binding protein [Firmicutes bacterium]|nr:extracellular solute-binding protein [Bacillota bacterium]MDD4694688.1 extracellular solute-binding protein [Bacillota bacterium]